MKNSSIYHIALFYQLIYIVISVPFIYLTRYTITTPDTFNYLLIAEQLSQGKFYEAISGHWSIGISILITPFMTLGFDGILVFKIINTLIGFFTLTLFLRIIIRTDDFSRCRVPNHPTAKVVSTITFITIAVTLPFILSMTLELTPDLLLTTLLLWYLKIVLQSCLTFSKCKTTRPNYGWKCGLIAGLAYWAKAYTLPFFVVHFVGWSTILLLINYYFYNKKQYNNEQQSIERNLKIPVISPSLLIKNLLVGCFIFALICTPYILALSTKLGQFSIGTSGTYNFALISPNRNHNQLTKNELINPKTKFTDFWAYEEPALFVEPWSPFASVSDAYYYLQFLASNVVRFCYFDYARHLIFFLIISILLLFYYKIKLMNDEWLFIGLMVFTAFVFTGGYFLVLVRERYFWLDNFIGLIVLFFIAEIFLRTNAVLPPPPSKGGDFSLREKLFTSDSSSTEDFTPTSPPLEGVSHSSPPLEEFPHSSPPLEGVSHSSPPLEEFPHSCPPLEGVSHSSPPLEGVSHSSPPLEGVSHSSPPLEGAGGWITFARRFIKKIFPLIIALATTLLIYDSIEMIQMQTSKQSFFKNLNQHLPQLEALRGKRIATNDTKYSYHHTDAGVYLMYELRYQFWGQIRTGRLRQEGLKEAYENEIDYFILWETPNIEQGVFENERLIFQDTLFQITIYKIDGT